MELDSTTALVTGGASGLGLAVVRQLTAEGARCVVADMNEVAGSAVADELGALFVKTNVTSEVDVTRAIEAAAEGGNFRTVVNAAGISRSQRTIARDGTLLPLEEFMDHVQINLVGTFMVCRAAAAAIAKTPEGRRSRGAIVNFGSTAAFEGQVGQVAYAASKGGVLGMTLPFARDFAPLGIRVNAVVPGAFDTPIFGEGPEAEGLKEDLLRSALFPRRLGKPEELASMVVELLRNDFMNGATVRVDGGVRLPAK